MIRRQQFPSILSLLIVILVLSPAGLSQSSVKFEPGKMLRGYSKAYFSEYAVLYDFREFEEADGKIIDAARLTALQELWTRVHKKNSAIRAKMELDPSLKKTLDLYREMRRHEFFKKITYETVTSTDPFIFFVARPRKDKDGYYESVANKFSVWLKAVKQQFEERVVKPTSLEIVKGHGRFGVAVLATKGEYRDYGQATRNAGLDSALAHYDPIRRLAVTYEDTFSTAVGKEKTTISTMMHEIVHALQHAYYRGKKPDDYLPSPIWFNEGLAEYLSMPSGDTPESMKNLGIQVGRLENFVDVLHQSPLAGFCLPVADLVSCDGPGYFSVFEALAKRRLAVDKPETLGYGMAVFYAEATILMHYLFEGDGGKLKAGVLKYTKRVMNGERGLKVFEESMAPATLAQIEKGMIAHARRLYKQVHPKRNLGPVPTIQKIDDAAYRAVAGSSAPATVPKFDVSGLALDGLTDDEILGGAFLLARTGDFSGALSLVGTVKKKTPRLERAGKRFAQIVKFRKDYLKQALGKSTLKLGKGKNAPRGKIVRADDKSFVILEKDDKRREFPISSLDPYNLGRAARKMFKGGRSWIKGYLKALSGGRARAKDLTAASDPLLAQDMEELSSFVKLGVPIAAMGRLAGLSKPEDSAEFKQALAMFKRAVKSHGETKLFQDRKNDLAELGRYLAWHALDPEKSGDLGLNGKSESLGNDRVRLIYDFSSSDQADDFLESQVYDATRREPLQHVAKGLKSEFVVKDGAFEGVGACCYALPVVWHTPMKMKFQLTLKRGVQRFLPDFRFGICDDGYGSSITCLNYQDMLAFDKNSMFRQILEMRSPARLIPEQVYHYEISHDGLNSVTLRRDGGPWNRIACGPLTSGRIYFFLHSEDAVRIDNLVIEGQPDVKSLRVLKAKRVDDLLRNLGLL